MIPVRTQPTDMPRYVPSDRERGPFEDCWPDNRPNFPTGNDAIAICRFAVSGQYHVQAPRQMTSPGTSGTVKRDSYGNPIGQSRPITPYADPAVLTDAEVARIRRNPRRSVEAARAVMDEAGAVWTWQARRSELFHRLSVA